MNDIAPLLAFAIASLAGLCIYDGIVRTFADLARDSLFRVRDDARHRFAASDALESAAYKDLRERLNAYLINLEKASIGVVLVYAFSASRRTPRPARELVPTGNKELDDFCRQCIERANLITIKHILARGAIWLPVASVLLYFAVARNKRLQSASKPTELQESKLYVVGGTTQSKLAAITQQMAGDTASKRLHMNLAHC